MALDVFFQQHREPEAARFLFSRLLGEYDVPEVFHIDKRWSDGAAVLELPVLRYAAHLQVISPAHGNKLIEPSHG